MILLVIFQQCRGCEFFQECKRLDKERTCSKLKEKRNVRCKARTMIKKCVKSFADRNSFPERLGRSILFKY